jgi:P4 family phage/plasmid primase-like protien
MAAKINVYNVAKALCDKHTLITPEELNEIFIYENGIYVKAEMMLKKKLVETMKGNATTNRISEVLDKIRIMTSITAEQIQSVPVNLIAVQNGILDVNEKKLLDFTPDYVFFNKLPVRFDKDAKCAEWDKFLEEVLSKERAEYLQRLVGSCLRRDCSFQKAGLLYGKGGEGKSTFLKTIVALLGRENCENFTLQQLTEDQFAAVNLYKKLANICPDIPYKGLNNSSLFKAFVAGDPVNARSLHRQYIKFIPYATWLFSANRIPKTFDLSDGFFDRWVLIKFSGKNYRDTGDEIQNYEKIFIDNPEEMSGILNWAIDGLFKADLYGFCDVRNTKAEWLKYSDSVFAFIVDKLQKAGKEDYLLKDDLYTAYLHYCSENRIDDTSADNSFHRKLREIMKLQEYNPKIDGKQKKAWRFVKFK